MHGRRAPEERAEEKQNTLQMKPLYKRVFLGYDFGTPPSRPAAAAAAPLLCPAFAPR